VEEVILMVARALIISVEAVEELVIQETLVAKEEAA
jgi:hypothetical protein